MEQTSGVLRDGQFLSVENPVDYEQVINRSRFIASVRFVSNHGEFEKNLSDITRKYTKATHYCWAYRLAQNPALEHSSDAGEPSGSAGRPILGALKKYSLQNTMAVVTRYYGGVKLGIRGLIAAYGETALRAIEKAEIVRREPMIKFCFACDYNMYDILIAELEKFEINMSELNTVFEENISGEIRVPKSLVDSISNQLDLLSHGKGRIKYFAASPE
jgi:uncharacterized YigZ family protein